MDEHEMSPEELEALRDNFKACLAHIYSRVQRQDPIGCAQNLQVRFVNHNHVQEPCDETNTTFEVFRLCARHASRSLQRSYYQQLDQFLVQKMIDNGLSGYIEALEARSELMASDEQNEFQRKMQRYFHALQRLHACPGRSESHYDYFKALQIMQDVYLRGEHTVEDLKAKASALSNPCLRMTLLECIDEIHKLQIIKDPNFKNN